MRISRANHSHRDLQSSGYVRKEVRDQPISGYLTADCRDLQSSEFSEYLGSGVRTWSHARQMAAVALAHGKTFAAMQGSYCFLEAMSQCKCFPLSGCMVDELETQQRR